MPYTFLGFIPRPLITSSAWAWTLLGAASPQARYRLMLRARHTLDPVYTIHSVVKPVVQPA